MPNSNGGEIAMTSMKKKVLGSIAAIGKFAAIKAAGSASCAGCHQPKEPEAVRKLRKS